MKKNRPFIDQYLVPAVTYLALPALIFAVLFQTECFKLVQPMSCVMAVMVGLVLAIWIMHYVLEQVDSENLGRRIRPDELLKLLRSLTACALILLALTFLATNIPAFLIGLGGCFMAAAALIYYRVWKIRREKKQKNEN